MSGAVPTPLSPPDQDVMISVKLSIRDGVHRSGMLLYLHLLENLRYFFNLQSLTTSKMRKI